MYQNRPVRPALRGFCIVKYLYGRDDIITRNGNSWDLIEVKSSTSVKNDHIADLAFQRVCFEDCGYLIGKVMVTHIDTAYVRKGKLEPSKLLITEDVTEAVAK